MISEPGLYRAIAQRRASSKLAPQARELIERFQCRLFHEVLPTLRRTGAYGMPGGSAAPITGPTETEMRLREWHEKMVG